MRILSDKNFFEPRARLLIQLGDKLIKNENIALLELIKNSYDADAKDVKLKLYNIESKKDGIIEILDDGTGMDMDIIQNAWLEPGSDNKAILFKKRKRTEKYGRLPIGEKGIGRFGVHKLGNKIELISKVKGGNEVVVKINWKKFSDKKYLKDAKFEVYERTPEYFIGGRKGTRIIISDLRTSWDRRMIREIYKAIFSLNSPFRKRGSFNVNVELDNPDLFEGLPNWEDIKQFSLFHFRSKFKGTEIVEFEYNFTPWENLVKVEPRRITVEDEFIVNRSTLEKKVNKKEQIINLAKNYGDEDIQLRIGTVEIEGYIFDRDRNILELSDVQGKQLIKQYLDEQGGVRVYRDNIRINEYGEKGNDWLNLDSRRVNTPAKKLSNNIILATTDIDSEESNALIEKTNREGFIENEAFFDLKDAILYVLSLFETLREVDKEMIRKKYNPAQTKEPVLSKLSALKSLINNKISNEPLKKEITKQLDNIEKEYEDIQNILLTSAGAGLTLSVGIHEVHKVLTELIASVIIEDVPDNIVNLIDHLDNLIRNYSDILKQSDSEQVDLKKTIKGAFFNNSYRLKAHQVQLVEDYSGFKENCTITCSKRLILGALTNIIDNSIYWMEKKYKKIKEIDPSYRKKIYINIENSMNNHLNVVIADNGPGFDIPTDTITRPFVSSKLEGMGLGLHIVSEIMKTMKGRVVFPEIGDYEVPEEFKRGAVVVLELKN